MELTQHHLWLKDDPLDELRKLRGELVAEGRSLIDLSMINPDLPPPRVLMDRLMEASMKGGNHRYAVSRGVRKLREAFALKYQNTFGAKLNPESEICVTMGTKDAIATALQVLCVPGDGVLLGMPAYPAYLSALKLARLTPSFFSLQKDEQAMLAEIGETLRKSTIKLIILNFPNNPTGIAVTKNFYTDLLKITAAHGAFVINDFVYGEMGFSGALPSLLSAAASTDQVAETYSLSKAYNVCGWRVGAFLGNAEAVRSVARLKSLIDYGTFLPIQYAAAAALSAKEDLVGPTVRTYRQRLKLLVRLLTEAGFEVEMPSAGASVWVKLKGSQAAGEYAKNLLQKEGIVLMPGELFGREFSSFVRIAAVAPEESLREVAARM
jgi:alanine-synthesizing transaminase